MHLGCPYALHDPHTSILESRAGFAWKYFSHEWQDAYISGWKNNRLSSHKTINFWHLKNNKKYWFSEEELSHFGKICANLVNFARIWKIHCVEFQCAKFLVLNDSLTFFWFVQVVCDYGLKFINCFAGFPGSVHDMRVFRYSGLQQMCTREFFPGGMHLLADSAYTCQENVIVPFRNNGYLTMEERFFNRCLSGARATVERSIALLKQRFRILLDRCPIRRQDFQPYLIFACCILHNICLMRPDELLLPVIPPDIDEIDEGPMTPTARQQALGVQKRWNILNVVNNIW